MAAGPPLKIPCPIVSFFRRAPDARFSLLRQPQKFFFSGKKTLPDIV